MTRRVFAKLKQFFRRDSYLHKKTRENLAVPPFNIYTDHSILGAAVWDEQFLKQTHERKT